MTATLLLRRSTPLHGTWDAAPATSYAAQSAPDLPSDRMSLGAPERGAPAPATDIVDEWGRQSFPASDPPANW